MDEPKKRGRPRKAPVIRIEVTGTGVRRRMVGGPDPACAKRAADMARRRAAKAPEPEPTAKKRASRKPVVPPHLKTSVERLHHDWSGKSEPTTTRDNGTVKSKLRRLKCEHGDHAELFIRDWEMVGSALRSIGFDGAGGGGNGQAFPAARIDAAARLREVRATIGAEAYDLCEAYLCRGLTVEQIHKAGGEQHVVLSAQIRAAVDSLARFYTPGRVRASRTHRAVVALISEIISKAERNA